MKKTVKLTAKLSIVKEVEAKDNKTAIGIVWDQLCQGKIHLCKGNLDSLLLTILDSCGKPTEVDVEEPAENEKTTKAKSKTTKKK